MTDLFFLPQTWNKTKVRLALLYEWGVYLLVVFFSVNTDSAWLFHSMLWNFHDSICVEIIFFSESVLFVGKVVICWVPSVFKRLFVVIVELSPLSSAIIPGLEKTQFFNYPSVVSIGTFYQTLIRYCETSLLLKTKQSLFQTNFSYCIHTQTHRHNTGKWQYTESSLLSVWGCSSASACDIFVLNIDFFIKVSTT